MRDDESGTMTFSPDGKLHLKEDEVVWRDAGDELVVLELSTTTYLTLNGAGKQLWLGLLDGASPDELSEMLSERFGIASDMARSDTDAFLAMLADRDLLDAGS